MSAHPASPGQLERALDRVKAGGMVVICDDPDREDEGDLCIAAEFVTAEAIAMMACEARGLICLSLPTERCEDLGLPPMVPANTAAGAPPFTVSIDAATGVTSGISAADRARTIQVAMAPTACPDDLVRPGHIFPLRARPGGVLERRGHTEASVELTRLAGLTPGGVLCEIMNADGSVARGRQVRAFCQTNDLPLVTVHDVAVHVRGSEHVVGAG